MITWLIELLQRYEDRVRRRNCPHSTLRGIYGDEVNHCGGWRLRCLDCRRFVDGPVALAEFRAHERDLT